MKDHDNDTDRWHDALNALGTASQHILEDLAACPQCTDRTRCSTLHDDDYQSSVLFTVAARRLSRWLASYEFDNFGPEARMRWLADNLDFAYGG